MAFDYCFKSLYPKLTNEDMIRTCILEYKEYCKITERMFTQVVRERRQKQEQAKSSTKWTCLNLLAKRKNLQTK